MTITQGKYLKPARNLSVIFTLVHVLPMFRIKEMRVKKTKDSIMRRNGLLLEHIMFERLHKDAAAVEYFRTPSNMEELRNQYRPQIIWP